MTESDAERVSTLPDAPLWERTLRVKLGFLCMAAVVGKEGDMAALTEDIITFCENLSGYTK